MISKLYFLLFAGLMSLTAAQSAEKPKPDSRFGNWLYKAPDAQVWKRSEKDGALTFSVPRPPGDFCALTLFSGAVAQPDFAGQFDQAVRGDQKAKGTIKIEADSGARPSRSYEGFEVLTRTLRAETSDLHTFHMYLAGRRGDRFDVAAFQTSSESSWKEFGAQASEFLLSLKMANSLSVEDLDRLPGKAAAADAPTLPGFGDAPVASTEKSPSVAAFAPTRIPDLPLEKSPLVINHSVIQKDGKPVNGLKLSQHDKEIASPSIALDAEEVIHVAFVEKHSKTYAYAVYHRSSSDQGKTWTPAKNLSEEQPGFNVGRCKVLVDGKNRVYVIWRSSLKEGFPASLNHWGGGHANLVYRYLEGGKWSKVRPVHPAGSPEKQNDGSISYFATVDPAGNPHVVWNTRPDKWHPELTKISGTYTQSLSGVGNGLVFKATLDGPSATAPREIFLPKIGGLGEQGGYGTYCDGLETLNGYVDSAGIAHFVAAVSSTHEPIRGKSRYQVIQKGIAGEIIDLPELSYHSWNSIPTLLVDAAGRQHVIALYNAGEQPHIRDYVIGSDEEPIIIRAAASVKGSVDGFQAYQAPGGRMIVIMQMNDTDERASGETYVSVSTGKGWSKPINVTNNAGRKSFASKKTSSESHIALATSYYPGPAAAAYDNQGHLLLLMINNEYGLFGSTAFGVSLAGGSSSTPTLQFLRL